MQNFRFPAKLLLQVPLTNSDCETRLYMAKSYYNNEKIYFYSHYVDSHLKKYAKAIKWLFANKCTKLYFFRTRLQLVERSFVKHETV